MMHRAYSVLTIKRLENEERVIEGIASTPTPDRVGDIVDPEGAKFALPMPLLWQHDASKPIGIVESVNIAKDGIRFRARIAKDIGVEYIDEAWKLIKAGLVRGISIGFRALESTSIGKGNSPGYRFSSYEWLELSAVTIPAHQEASILSVKSADSKVLAALGKGTSVARLDHAASNPGDSGKSINHYSKGKPAMKTIREQIQAFEAKRAANVARQSDIMSKSSEEGRTLEKSESDEYDELRDEVKAIDDHLTRLRDHEKSVVANASIVPSNAGTDPEAASAARGSVANVRGNAIISVSPNIEKGTAFTRYAMLLAASRGNLTQAAEMSKRFNDTTPQVERVLKAAVAAGTTTDSTWAAPLVDYTTMSQEFIELLRPNTVIGKIQGFRRVPFNVRMPRQTAGASAGWVGQGLPKPVSKLAFDTVEMKWAKISVIIALTEELVRFSNPSAEALCRQDMIDTISTFMDEQFCDPDIAVSADVSPASITNGVLPTPSTGSTVDAIMTDVGTLFNRFLSAGHSSLKSGVWIMNPRSALYLSQLRTAQDVYAFPGISMQGGVFYGLPVVTSASISLDQGSPSATYMILADAAEILLADDGQVTLDVSREASLQMDSAPSSSASAMISLWQNNLVALRAERYINWLKRRASAAVWMGGVAY